MRGLEVVAVDPGGPASEAGLKQARNTTALGILYLFAGPLALLANPLLESAELDAHGDLIVAAEGHPTACVANFIAALADLKPGDALHLTVVRFARGVPSTMNAVLIVGKARGQVAVPASSAEPSASPRK